MWCKFVFYFFAIFNAWLAYVVITTYQELQEELYYTTHQFIKKYGYDLEEHDITTHDGYVNTAFRILPPGKKATGTPILFISGLFCNSDLYVIFGPKYDLVFFLVDEGYDVWLMNDRGSRYNKGRTQKDTLKLNDTDEYFGFHDTALGEVRASIDYIIKETGHPKIAANAISAGSAAVLALLSTLPEYNEKLLVVLNSGPAFSLSLFNPVLDYLLTLAKDYPNFFRFIRITGEYEYRPLVATLLVKMKGSHVLFGGFNPTLKDDPSKFDLIKTVRFSSSRNIFGFIKHLKQNAKPGSAFRMRDYGPELNLKMYNTTVAPEYDLSKVTVPMKFYFVKDDLIAPYNEMTKGVLAKLKNQLGTIVFPNTMRHVNFVCYNAAIIEFVEDFLSTLKQYA